MKTKNIALSGLLIFSSFMSYCFQNEMSLQRQDMIRQSLYDGEIDPSFLDRETIATYIQILKDHRAVLRYKIDNHCGYFNNADAIKGTICAWFGFKFAKGILLLPLYLMLSDQYSERVVNDRVGGVIAINTTPSLNFLQIRPFLAAAGCCSLVISLLLAKGAYGYLHKAWYAKENALRDLARDEELLVLLESLNTN